MGHALNKVLKDIINRYNLIRGKRVHYVPGWDCHGLPIEHKALAAIGSRPYVMAARHVTAQAGTGLVHSAPAHGHEDYEAAMTAGILPDELRCPVNDEGRFTSDLAKWTEDGIATALIGKEVLGDGSDAVVEILRNQGVLLAEQKIEHRYPYDWKSKKPIIVRATLQWFADVEGIKNTAVEALSKVHFHPPIFFGMISMMTVPRLYPIK
ncbi:isoleucine-tRNA ligase [Kwoniella dejecticola CBS 10117]|uniref:Isoleucine-tRNA ligase n=1 Tax=Kwoniella dejecticola CBS 10117 TaxID=1296121 RepID=A0AAJ8KSL2_9TREE